MSIGPSNGKQYFDPNKISTEDCVVKTPLKSDSMYRLKEHVKMFLEAEETSTGMLEIVIFFTKSDKPEDDNPETLRLSLDTCFETSNLKGVNIDVFLHISDIGDAYLRKLAISAALAQRFKVGIYGTARRQGVEIIGALNDYVGGAYISPAAASEFFDSVIKM